MSEVKTLRVCLSKDLPALVDRSFDYIYFAYDKLTLYSGQNTLTENFAIVQAIPSDPVVGMMYILDTDGSVHRYIDYKDVTIATIESSEQIDILKKAGTGFFINSDHTYFDSQTRTLTLPFNNGTYELAVSVRDDQKFTNDTILKYNETTERFEIYGPQSEEFIDYSKPFRGAETYTVKVIADGPKIKANVKISEKTGNILKSARDGLYLDMHDVVDKTTFNNWTLTVNDFKGYANAVLDKIESEMAHCEQIISDENIKAIVLADLRTKYSTIDTALANYQTVVDSLSGIETELLQYATNEIFTAKNNLQLQFNENTNWTTLDSSGSYEQEVDYYDKAEEVLNPTTPEVVSIIEKAFQAYIDDGGEI